LDPELPGERGVLAPHRVRRRVASRRGVLLDERERVVPLAGVRVVHGLDDLAAIRWGREQRGREYEVLQHGSSSDIYLSSRYPALRTFKMWFGAAGSASSLRRSSATCVSTVRLKTSALKPQTSVRSSIRDATAPRRRSSAASRSNSFE